MVLEHKILACIINIIIMTGLWGKDGTLLRRFQGEPTTALHVFMIEGRLHPAEALFLLRAGRESVLLADGEVGNAIV